MSQQGHSHRYQKSGLAHTLLEDAFSPWQWEITDTGRGFRGRAAKNMRTTPSTSIALGAFISSNNEMISKQKLDMPKAIKGPIALRGESARQELAAGVQWAVRCRARWCPSPKPCGRASPPVPPGRLPKISLSSSKREDLAWRGHHGFKQKDKWRF